MGKAKTSLQPTVSFQDLGTIPFGEAWELQEQLLKENTQIKLKKALGQGPLDIPTQNHLLFCEHPHVYTLGKSGKDAHLLLNEEAMSQRGVSFYRINRGGDITYHGPGQLVAYPIWDLDKFKRDLHWYLRQLEEIIILVCGKYGVQAGRLEGATGVWIDTDKALPRKICAMGIRCSRWVSMHGLALNVNTDLSYFNGIVPCGISDKAVTSLQAETGDIIPMKEVKTHLKEAFTEVFKFKWG